MGNTGIYSPELWNSQTKLPEPSFMMAGDSIQSYSKTTTITSGITLVEHLDEYGVASQCEFKSHMNATIGGLCYDSTDEINRGNYETYICSMTIKNIFNPCTVPIPIRGSLAFRTDVDAFKTAVFSYDIDECTGDAITTLKNPCEIFVNPTFQAGSIESNVLFTYAPIKKALFLENSETSRNGKDFTKIDTDTATYKVLRSYEAELDNGLANDKNYDGVSGKLVLMGDGRDKSKKSEEDHSIVLMETKAYDYFKKKFKAGILDAINPVDFSSSWITIDMDKLDECSDQQKSALVEKFKKDGLRDTTSNTEIGYSLSVIFTIEVKTYRVPRLFSNDLSSTGRVLLNNGKSNHGSRTSKINNQSIIFGTHPLCNDQLLRVSIDPMKSSIHQNLYFTTNDGGDKNKKKSVVSSLTSTNLFSGDTKQLTGGDGYMKEVDLNEINDGEIVKSDTNVSELPTDVQEIVDDISNEPLDLGQNKQ